MYMTTERLRRVRDERYQRLTELATVRTFVCDAFAEDRHGKEQFAIDKTSALRTRRAVCVPIQHFTER